jgi:hypothetical protein
MTFKGTKHLRAKIVIDKEVIEQTKELNYLEYSVSYTSNNEIYNKLQTFQYPFGTIWCNFKTSSKERLLKLYKTKAVPTGVKTGSY